MPNLAFVNNHVWKFGRVPRDAACAARMAASTKVQLAKPQGPYCPLIDQSLLRHCLICVSVKERKLKNMKSEKETNVEQLLLQAKQKRKQRGLAERYFLRALVADPRNSRTYFLYALQVQRRDPLLARELFRRGSKENPTDARLIQAWGLFESKQGKLARAQRLLRRSVDLQPLNAPVLKWKVVFPEGVVNYRREKS